MNTDTQLVSQFDIVVGTAGGWFTKKWLLDLQLSCDSKMGYNFDDFVFEHYSDCSFLQDVRIEVLTENRSNTIFDQVAQSQHLTLSDTVARIAWLIEADNRGEDTLLDKCHENIVVILHRGKWFELRVCFDERWCIALDEFAMRRFSAGDRFLVFTKPV